MTGKLTRDIGSLPKFLYEHGIRMVTVFGVLDFDEGDHTLRENPRASDRRQELSRDGLLIPMWLCFSVGIECLLKAVLLKHQIAIVSRGSASRLENQLVSRAPNYQAALEVSSFIRSFEVYSDSCPWMKCQLQEQGISHLYDVKTGTMNSAKDRLGDLVDKGVLSTEESDSLKNSLIVLAALRRNIDAHTFFGLTIGGSIQHDLERLYLPAASALAKAYHH